MDIAQKLKAFVRKNKTGLIREGRFALIVVLWVAFYVGIMRHRWTQIEEREIVRNFNQSTTDSFAQFEARHQFWELQAKKIVAFTTDQPPSTVRIQQDSWAAIYDSHPEWLATHLISRRDNFEPTVTVTLTSKQVRRWFPRDKDSPVKWSDEVQSSALQMTSAKAPNSGLFIQSMRSLDKENQWIQILYRVKSPKPDWSHWVVHTFSEKMLPELLTTTENHSAILFFNQLGKSIPSGNFTKLKIERSEIIELLKNNKSKYDGFSAQEFAISKKTSWLSWSYSKNLDASFIKILPNDKIPSTGRRETPSLFADWLLSLLWMIISAMALWWSYTNKHWWLSLKDPPKSSDSDPQNVLAALLNSKFRHRAPPSERHPLIDAEWEFCRQMLGATGTIGEIKLTADAKAIVEVSPSTHYKGSWWLIEQLDENRIIVVVGDATGEGLAAATAAYSLRHFVSTLIKSGGGSRDTEAFVGELYERCNDFAEGLLLGTTHTSLFSAIIEVNQQKLCFLNAGYPAPILKLSSRKKLSLISYCDPIGLGYAGRPLPRWLNLSHRAQIILCNIGVRNTDLDEIDESELVKIQIHPFGVNDQAESLPVADAA